MAARKKSTETETNGGLRVTAPLVEVKVGDRRVQYRFGDILPEGVDEESVKHLESLDYVEKADAPASDADTGDE